MTDKVQKIREEVARIQLYTQSEVLKQILDFIDSLQEEPVSEELEEASKEWLRPQLDKSYVNYGEAKMMELTHFDGYAMLDAIEFGAKWQKEQMMKDAITAHCFGFQGAALFSFRLPAGSYLVGSEVKVSVIKED